jgi:outer membrane murein-binding lipoprotein Lpp
MKNNNSVVLLLAAFGCSFLTGCGSKQTKDQAQSDATDQRSAQEANQALENVDHKVASGLYAQKTVTPTAQPSPTPTPQ